MSRPVLASGDRLIVKVGTSSLVGPDGSLDDERLASLCKGIAAVRQGRVDVVLVSSGAIAAGLGPLKFSERPSDIPSLQAVAAVGQGKLLSRYSRLFADQGMVAAQLLLTRYDFMQRQQYLNARNTLDRLIALGAVPIVNENDTVAVDEIRFGENDRLAALVAHLAVAKVLLLLTDADGVHAADPRTDPDAPLIKEIKELTPELERAAGGRGSTLASGGMASKIAAAWVASFSGVGVVVARASEPDVIQRIAAGEELGSYFHPRHVRLSARKLWIAFGQPPNGTVTVDGGARRAVVEGKRSLLPVGVTGVLGDFAAGDTVDVAAPDGRVFARGLVRFGAQELEAARGRRSAEVAGREVIHRDQLVVLEHE
ncbi:MAG TPA: glutamate 5-kinase [Actinomycetota bacterium]|jgi:glutamate 5-kinase|nr:glutamate 5-kinase [Actinomycetota bacterium]